MKHRLLIIITAALALAATGCHSGRHTVRGSRGRPVTTVSTGPSSGTGSQQRGSSASERRLIETARRWLGTPYRYGGNDRSGVDCSGFTCAVFVEATGIKLPRSSREQADFCRSVERRRLRTGDLVFFTSKGGGSRINHVAIYIGDNKIIHATSSRGVIISDLDEKYWSSHFYRCGRVEGW